MAEGDGLTVCDGSGIEYDCTLTRIRDEECICKIHSFAKSEREPKIAITLYMAYPKGDKLETVIQKAVELGATAIVPFESSRCIKRPSADKADKITDRLSRIAEEAAKQCGRSKLPSVSKMIKLSDLLTEVSGYDLPLFCYEGDGTLPLGAILKEEASKNGGNLPKSISIIIGSEGGFSQAEAQKCRNAGMKMTGLGKRILRTETASGFVLACLVCFSELS
jgi:16S rRNA (uracil1498-N3)-methyltransferase